MILAEETLILETLWRWSGSEIVCRAIHKVVRLASLECGPNMSFVILLAHPQI